MIPPAERMAGAQVVHCNHIGNGGLDDYDDRMYCRAT